ncbi:SDR family oxidoreductase [Actinokineospora auranticolor]|uniref:NAD(P)-dependent dehydrogenase (Short-subunit alcohol dehydrogenase family) n=1 Tax=Actinokineospora auranticolor TaxID=155976 RepID=A0A2S6GCD0_9PSEU|nr:SDR family oxidoreductase [Actinokineospora auranticolor]PPK62217.1 NAD(P)-dependent dehydrogenase (short-subunit alcohol dehydrogenase family) [Actinokineospora auranticolor]
MTDKVVVITGAGTGIGRATALAFAELGADVVAVGRRPGPLGEIAGGRIRALPADITVDARRVVDTVVEWFGRVDVVVNNAGIVASGALESVAAEDVAAQLETNLVAPIKLTQAALPHLPEGGVVVNVSTAIGQRGWPGNSVYSATKAALDSITRSWTVEFAPRGIRVVAVAPGAVETPIADHQGLTQEQRREVRAWQIAHTPLGRVAAPEEVAWAITRLASPEASFVTGVVLPVDGGAVVA